MSKQDRMQKAAECIAEAVYKQIRKQRMSLEDALAFCREVSVQVGIQETALEEDIRRERLLSRGSE